MNPMLTMASYLIRNPFTSGAGAGLIMTNIGVVLTMIGGGTPFATIVADQHFQNLLAGFAALSAKDINVTGGRKSNA
jgi:hypothetical protein